MRVLIVGARGQLGQELQATAPQRHQVHAIARPELDLNDREGIFHWTDSGTTSWYELALAIQEEASALGLLERSASLKPVRTEDFGARAPRPSHSALDCRETLRALEVEPWHWRRSLREMLAELQA